MIGNPPYGAEFPKFTIDYLKPKFSTFVWRGESYLLFVETAINLLKTGGRFGYIIPDTYLNLGFTQSLRTFLLQHTQVHEIVLLPSNVFSSATVDTTLLFTEKTKKSKTFHESIVSVKLFNKKGSVTSLNEPNRSLSISTSSWYEQKAFLIQSDLKEFELVLKIEKDQQPLSHFAEMFSGIKVYTVGAGKPPQTVEISDTKPFTSDQPITEEWKPFYDGKHVGRYQRLWNNNNWIYYGKWLAEPRKAVNFTGEKLLIRKIVGDTLIATYVSETSYCNTLLHVLKIRPDASSVSYQYLLGILNSQLIGWYFRNKFQISAEDTFPQIMIRDIVQFPIPLTDQATHDYLAKLVTQMLDLNKRLATSALDPHGKTALKRQIEAVNEEIDQVIYGVYDLTEEEIEMVEKQ